MIKLLISLILMLGFSFGANDESEEYCYSELDKEGALLSAYEGGKEEKRSLDVRVVPSTVRGLTLRGRRRPDLHDVRHSRVHGPGGTATHDLNFKFNQIHIGHYLVQNSGKFWMDSRKNFANSDVGENDAKIRVFIIFISRSLAPSFESFFF